LVWSLEISTKRRKDKDAKKLFWFQ